MTKNLARAQCIHCYGWHTYRNGHNKRKDGNIQRWYCQDCDVYDGLRLRTFQESDRNPAK